MTAVPQARFRMEDNMAHAHEPEHQAAASAPQEHSHPSPARYVFIGVVLTVLTMIEVGIYYVEGLGRGLPLILIALSAVKFFIVVAFFMHLKFDSKLFAWLFAAGMAVATSVMLALLGLFDAFS